MSHEKWIWIITGPNGAGKSHLCANAPGPWQGLPCLDPDTDAARIQSARHLPPEDAHIQAFAEQEQAIAALQKRGQSFVLNTTIPGKSRLRLVEDLREEGWKIGVVAIGVATPELALERVRQRQLAGGHDVAEPIIRTNWEACPKATAELLNHADQFVIYDNSGQDFTEITRHIPGAPLAREPFDKGLCKDNPYLLALWQHMAQRGTALQKPAEFRGSQNASR